MRAPTVRISNRDFFMVDACGDPDWADSSTIRCRYKHRQAKSGLVLEAGPQGN